ncbi:hypothetical protein RB595_009416 [Gaeumannomyces hyphopodioides]
MAAPILGRPESALARGIAALLVLAAARIAWIILSNHRSPLRRCPGPFFARWTDLWRFYHTLRGDIHLVNKRMHEKYGPVVRTGPNNLDLDLPELIKTIYTTDGRWRKTGFYPPASNVVDGRVVYNVFSLCDPVEHARQKRPIAKHYSLPSILQLEGHVDEAILLLCRQLEDRFMTPKDESFGESFDLGEWVSMYAWDVIGQITFSKHFGYLEKGCDFDGHIWLSGVGSDYLAAVGQLPYLDRWVDKNPVFPIGGATRLLAPTLRRFRDRMRGVDEHKRMTHDFLDRFVQAKVEHPDVVDDGQIVSYLAINMLAGADTTAIAVKAVLYHVLRTPRVKKRLEESLAAAGLYAAAGGPGEDAVPTYAEARAVRYLEAVVREAMRLHPGVAMTLPRHVPQPDGGPSWPPSSSSSAAPPPLVLPDGTVVPPGTSVGMNPYVVGRNRAVFGGDADDFRPERWLRAHGETEGGFAKRLAAMNSADLTFGAGSRVCLGRHLGLVEVYKVVATLLARYEMDMVRPEKEWWTRNGFFLRQKGLRVRMRRRDCVVV